MFIGTTTKWIDSLVNYKIWKVILTFGKTEHKPLILFIWFEWRYSILREDLIWFEKKPHFNLDKVKNKNEVFES